MARKKAPNVDDPRIFIVVYDGYEEEVVMVRGFAALKELLLHNVADSYMPEQIAVYELPKDIAAISVTASTVIDFGGIIEEG